MTPKSSCFCRSSRRNLFVIDHIEDKLARDSGPADGSHLNGTSFAPSRHPISGTALVPTLISAPISAPAPILPSLDKLLKQFMKAYLELNQGPR